VTSPERKMLSLYLTSLAARPLQPELVAVDVAQVNTSATWLTQMSAQVHHALVEAKALEHRVALAAAAHDDVNGTDGAHGDSLLREVTFKPGKIDAGMHVYRRALLLHELAMSCRLVMVLDDPDPSSRDATFLSMWQLDGKKEPAPPVHANGGDGYRKLRLTLSGLAWQKHDRAQTAFATRFYEGRVDAGFYSTRWYWLPASYDKTLWLDYDQFSNSSRAQSPPPSPPATAPAPVSPPQRFTPPSSPLPSNESPPDGAEAAVLQENSQGPEAGSGSPDEWLVAEAGLEDQLDGQEEEGSLSNSTNGTVAHVERLGEGNGMLSHSPPVLGMQSLVCYKLIALFKPGELEQGRKAMAEALLPEVISLPGAVAATALHDDELQKLLWLVLSRTPFNLTRLAEVAQQNQVLAPLLSEPLVTEVFTDASIYWPGSL